MAKIIKSDFYVAVLLTETDDVEEAALTVKGVLDILKQGQFDLRNLYSNNMEAFMTWSGPFRVYISGTLPGPKKIP